MYCAAPLPNGDCQRPAGPWYGCEGLRAREGRATRARVRGARLCLGVGGRHLDAALAVRVELGAAAEQDVALHRGEMKKRQAAGGVG